MKTVLNIFKEILQIRKVYVSEVQDTEVKKKQMRYKLPLWKDSFWCVAA